MKNHMLVSKLDLQQAVPDQSTGANSLAEAETTDKSVCLLSRSPKVAMASLCLRSNEIALLKGML